MNYFLSFFCIFIILLQLCEKGLWSVHLSGWGLHLITITCPIFLLNLFLTSRAISLCGACVRVKRAECQLLEPGWVCRKPWPGTSYWRAWVSVPATGEGGDLSCHTPGWEWSLSQKTAIRRNLHEQSKGGAPCQRLEEAVWQVLRHCDDNCPHLLHTRCAWVAHLHTSIWTNQQEGDLDLGWGISMGSPCWTSMSVLHAC